MNLIHKTYVFRGLGLLCVLLSMALAQLAVKVHFMEADIKLTRDIVRRLEAQRQHALRSGVSGALESLRSFDVSADATGLQKPLEDILDIQRRRAAGDIIAYLRSMTGQDFGDVPEKWVQGLESRNEIMGTAARHPTNR